MTAVEPAIRETWPATRPTPRRDPGAERSRPYTFLLPGAEALAEELLTPLRAHYRCDPDVEVIVDRRAGEWQPETRAVDPWDSPVCCSASSMTPSSATTRSSCTPVTP